MAQSTVPGDKTSHNPEFVEAVTLINIQNAVEQIEAQSEIIAALMQQGKVAIMPALYDVTTGQVRWLS
jgi:carbonic anhydrase